jgi:hypothetical protein
VYVDSLRLDHVASEAGLLAFRVERPDDDHAHRNSISLNSRVWLSMAASVGGRSMLDAPKNPTTPSVSFSTYSASSGQAMEPP